MVFKILLFTLAACVMVGFLHQTLAIPPSAVNPGANPWIPPWIANAPFIPKWIQCKSTEPLGRSCQDCSTKRVCTPIGGFTKLCTDATKPHCNLGECSAIPSAECVPPEAPAAANTPIKVPVAEASSAEVPSNGKSPAEVAASEAPPAKIPPTETSPVVESVDKVSPSIVSVAESSPAQVLPAEASLTVVPVAEVSPAEIPPAEASLPIVPVAEVSPAEVPPAEVSSAEISENQGPVEISPLNKQETPSVAAVAV